MIIWFSGTGNSRWVAERLALLLNERMVSAAEALTTRPEDLRITLARGERLGFVFPTYSWGPAPVITEVIQKMELSCLPDYCFMVTTCGDDVGLEVEIIQRELMRKGVTLNSAFSVTMPNNYINMKGFDVDPDIVREEKLHAAPKRVEQVAINIAEGRNVVDVVKGKWAWVKSRVIRPWFVRNAMSDKRFRVLSDACTRCGACEKNCPMHNISIANGEVKWNGRCAMCLNCLHRCPARAIQYGKATVNKGRYFFGS